MFETAFIDDEIGGHSGGELLPEQAEALRPHVLGRHVHDLGAGNGLLSGRLLGLGARHVTLVDQSYKGTCDSPPSVRIVGIYVHEYMPRDPFEVAFVSWPPYLFAPRDVRLGLPRLLAAAPVVAYLGSNFGRVCGNLELWRHLATREVLTHVPDPRNTLIVYGRKDARIPGQGLLPEEKAALYRHVTPLPVYGVTYG